MYVLAIFGVGAKLNSMSKETKPKILVIVGTVREKRVGRKIAEWYFKEAVKTAPDLDFELFDVAELNLPVFHEPVPPMMHKYSRIQQKIAEKIGSADGFIFVTGEYNHSIPGSLKNFIDYIFAEWNYKAAAFVGYGGAGGFRSIEHLIQVMTELKVVSVANSFNNLHIPKVWDAFDEKGNFKPETVQGDIAKQLKDFSWWVHATKRNRSEIA